MKLVKRRQDSLNEFLSDQSGSMDLSVGSAASVPRSSMRKRDSISSRGDRSVSFSEDGSETFIVKKVTNDKDRKALWIQPKEYEEIQHVVRTIATIAKKTGNGVDESNGQHTIRGLEHLVDNSNVLRAQAAKESVLMDADAASMYSYFARSSVQTAQEMAKKDAQAARDYHNEAAVVNEKLAKKGGIGRFLKARR